MYHYVCSPEKMWHSFSPENISPSNFMAFMECCKRNILLNDNLPNTNTHIQHIHTHTAKHKCMYRQTQTHIPCKHTMDSLPVYIGMHMAI